MYRLQTNLRTVERIQNREWAIHYAQCCASFFNTTVFVIDEKTGEAIAYKIYPPRR